MAIVRSDLTTQALLDVFIAREAAILCRIGPVEPLTGCRHWLGSRVGGYGAYRMRSEGRTRSFGAHLVVWMLTNRVPWPDVKLNGLHSCDNGICVNPEHVSPGTHQKNMADLHLRGRGRNAKGRMHPRAKLTEDQVVEIRNRRVGGESSYALAKRFSVDRALITRICTGMLWTEIGGPINPAKPNSSGYTGRIPEEHRKAIVAAYREGARMVDLAQQYSVSVGYCHARRAPASARCALEDPATAALGKNDRRRHIRCFRRACRNQRDR